MEKADKKKSIVDLTDIATALIDLQLKEDTNTVAIINNAPIVPYGAGGMHVTIPSKYDGGNHRANITIKKKAEVEVKEEDDKNENCKSQNR